MAATIATAVGYAKSGKKTEVTRLGPHAAEGRAATWQTFAAVSVESDGSGEFQERRGAERFTVRFGPESGPLNAQVEA